MIQLYELIFICKDLLEDVDVGVSTYTYFLPYIHYFRFS